MATERRPNKVPTVHLQEQRRISKSLLSQFNGIFEAPGLVNMGTLKKEREKSETYGFSFIAPYRAPPALKNLTFPDIESALVSQYGNRGFLLDQQASSAGTYRFISSKEYREVNVSLMFDDGNRTSGIGIVSKCGTL